jgi:putative nucleotidyltransferase with HDIG domain
MLTRNITILQHSSTVARAAYEIARRTSDIDTNIAYQCGMFHDVGKLYLSSEEAYKHPYFGYEIMLKNAEYLLAQVCVAHPFPVFDSDDYLKYYCHDDIVEMEKIKQALAKVKNNIYVQLIQFCDKISGVNSFMQLDDKFALYKKRKETGEQAIAAIKANHTALTEIKNKLDVMVGEDVYSVLKIGE